MKKRNAESLWREVLPASAQWTILGHVAYLRPIEDVARGFLIERSSVVNAFYVWTFFMPLYVPTDDLVLTFGHRLRHNRVALWEEDSPDLAHRLRRVIESEGMAFLRDVDSICNIVKKLGTMPGSSTNALFEEAAAYSLARLGEFSRANSLLENFAGRMNEAVPWQAERRTRATILQRLCAQGAEAVANQLDVWRRHTLIALGLPE